jgi:hypothetical protein
MPFSLNITPDSLVNPKPTGSGILSEEDVKDVFDIADSRVPEKYRFFSDDGSCGPSCRAYTTRLVTAKLAGTGLVAALAAQSAVATNHYAWTCGLSAAVNLIATVHYVIIVLVRSQIMPRKYEIWTIGIDRTKQKCEEEATQTAIYVQESIVDGLRFSDWVATLVLMTLALGADRDKLYKDLPDLTNPTWEVSPWWLAALQVAMVSFGSWWRFYFNEGRDRESCTIQVMAAVTFLLACCCFAVIVTSLLDGLWPVLTATPPTASEAQITDALMMHLLVLVWIGYPLVFVYARIVNWRTELNRYQSRASTDKDILFGSLDVCSKAGLAIYASMRCLSPIGE